jgi:uncharacterized protein (TIGR03118 family)
MVSQNRSHRTLSFLASLVVLAGFIASPAAAQYAITNLVSNQAGKAKHQDSALVNAWGMSFSSGGPFWISDNGTGESTFYTGKGVKVGDITIPPASGTGTGSPTGQVYNTTTDFPINGTPAFFIFDTLDGTISGWNGGTSAVIAVTAASGTSYTGLAIGQNGGANFLFAADAANDKVDIYNGSFTKVGSFTDSKLAGLSVYNVQNVKGDLYVTFVDSAFSKGAVDIFDTAGNLIKTFTKDAHLKAPWGVALAPKNFGPASNALLVGNLADGRITAFNAKSGKFMTQLKGKNKKVLSVNGLWALAFGEGGGSNGNSNQLFFAAGPNGYVDGLFGVINFK